MNRIMETAKAVLEGSQAYLVSMLQEPEEHVQKAVQAIRVEKWKGSCVRVTSRR